VRELKDRDAQVMVGMHIGDEFDSSVLAIEGGVVKITGGSDRAGFPMRRDIMGGSQKLCPIDERNWIQVWKKGRETQEVSERQHNYRGHISGKCSSDERRFRTIRNGRQGSGRRETGSCPRYPINLMSMLGRRVMWITARAPLLMR